MTCNVTAEKFELTSHSINISPIPVPIGAIIKSLMVSSSRRVKCSLKSRTHYNELMTFLLEPYANFQVELNIVNSEDLQLKIESLDSQYCDVYTNYTYYDPRATFDSHFHQELEEALTK